MRIDEPALQGREIEIVRDGLRWSVNFPTTPALSQYSMLDQMDEGDSLFARNRAARLDHLTNSYRGAFDSEAMHALLSDHGERADGTFMTSMCMHPKHAAGKQTCASMIALPGQRTMRFYDPNPCRNKMKNYTL